MADLAIRTTSDSDAAADPAELGRLGEALARLTPALERFLDGADAATFPPYPAGAVPSEPGPLPESGRGLDATIAELAMAVEWGCRIGAPGWWGFITTAGTTAGSLAQVATAVAGGQRYLVHAFNALERTGLRWLADLCGLPAGVHGVFTSGGSTANLVALGTARQAAYERRGFDVGADGAPAGPPGRIYASAHAHRTIHRSAAVLGLGRNAVVEIPTDPRGRVDVVALEAALRDDARRGIVPIATVAVAGTTDTGSVDPIAAVVEIARRYDSWVHVDGAYGLVANASPSFAHLFEGVTEADSWIVDPHKWLATGLGVGAVFVRDEGVLTRAFTEGHAAYLEGSFSDMDVAVESQFDVISGPWSDQGVELSAPPRGAIVWAVLNEIGRAGVAVRVERDCGFARRVAERATSHPRLELLLEPDLSIACFRYRPPAGHDVNAVNRQILERLRRRSPFIPTSTMVGGAFAIRPCFINPRTAEAHVDGLVDEVIRLGDDLVS
jgi:glutamate/tyrosine decarboxylase-like PLP-dependent enzyme